MTVRPHLFSLSELIMCFSILNMSFMFTENQRCVLIVNNLAFKLSSDKEHYPLTSAAHRPVQVSLKNYQKLLTKVQELKTDLAS